MSLQVILISAFAVTFLYYAEASLFFLPSKCLQDSFKCLNGRCIPHERFCDGTNDCGDNLDEAYCDVSSLFVCPYRWSSCQNHRRCIPSLWKCTRGENCPSLFEDTKCNSPTGTTVMPTTTIEPTTMKTPDEDSIAKLNLKSWLLNKRKTGSRTDKWGSEVHRIAVALHLADIATFSPGNSVGEEIRYELTIQLLRHISKDQKMSSQELALYIHALLVACIDPRDFNGNNLVMQLRKRVEVNKNYTNPFLILSLCNAGDTMTLKDLERVNVAYDSQHRPFWTDSQALASMAMSCISSRSDVSVDERLLKDMLQELKRHQFRNGTVDNFRTTALVTQALFIHDSFTKDFDMDSAIKVLVDGLKETNSILNAYYILPVLYRKSLLNVSSSHCIKQPMEEEEALQKALEVNEEKIIVQYSIWFGDEINLARTWRLKMRLNSTIYDVIETVSKIDKRQKVEYNVVDGKPYVAQLNGKEDDPERGIFWFVYLKTLNSDENPKIVEESPVDIKLKPNQEIILWYKFGPWNGQSQNLQSS